MLKRLGIIIFISLLSFQYALASNKSCPSIDQVKSVKFDQAFRANGMWVLVSPEFSYEEETWNVTFATVMLNAESTDEALREGQAYFDHAPIIEYPSPKDDDGKLCSYVPLGEKYFIFAKTPPLFRE